MARMSLTKYSSHSRWGYAAWRSAACSRDSNPHSLQIAVEEVAHLGVRLLMQVALEAEVTEFLGRDRYVRGERARKGSRNGHCAELG